MLGFQPAFAGRKFTCGDATGYHL